MIIRLIVFIALYASSLQLHANQSSPAYNAMPGLDCVINPSLVVDISSPVAGVIEKLHVERSQRVAAGQDLVQLESSVERAALNLAKYRAEQKSGVGLGNVNVKFDKLRKQRVESLIDEKNVSKEIVDQVERDLQLSRWNLIQAKEVAKIRQFELHSAEVRLRQKSITAPFDGFVLDTFKFRGEHVDDQAILRLAQLDPLVIEAIVPMEHYGTVQLGMHADVMPEILLKEKVKAKVIAVDRIGDTASNTFGVKLTMPNPDNRIPAGLKCVLKFIETMPTQSKEIGEKPASYEIAEKPASYEIESSTIPFLVDSNKLTTRTVDSVVVAEPLRSSTPDLAAAQKAEPSSYIVLMKQPASSDDTDKLVEKLRSVGVIDFVKFKSKSEKRLISLGVYSKRVNAENRQANLAQLGFDTFTSELFD